jgi:hypothetical protein
MPAAWVRVFADHFAAAARVIKQEAPQKSANN